MKLILMALISFNCHASFLPTFTRGPAKMHFPIEEFASKVATSQTQKTFYVEKFNELWNEKCRHWIAMDYIKGMEQMPRCANAIYPKARPSIPVILFALYGTWLGNEFLHETKRQWDAYINEPIGTGRPSFREDLDHVTRPRIPGDGHHILPGGKDDSGSSRYCGGEVDSSID